MKVHHYIKELGITQEALALLLSVQARTVRRWVKNPEECPGPPLAALRAWVLLKRYGLPWRPTDIMLGELSYHDTEQNLLKLRMKNINLQSILSKVEKRGGAQIPWKINLKKGTAKLETMLVKFRLITNGEFVPTTYRRTDKEPDLDRDKDFIEDAYFCISNAIRKERNDKLFN